MSSQEIFLKRFTNRGYCSVLVALLFLFSIINLKNHVSVANIKTVIHTKSDEMLQSRAQRHFLCATEMLH